MVRKLLFRSSEYPYHVTTRSNNKDWFYVPIDTLWRIFSYQLFGVSVAYGARIHAFVLMSNHFHLLISTPDENLDDVMEYLLRETSRAINTLADRENHVFGGRYKWSSIHVPLYYAHALKYIYLNPIRAGMCARVEEYAFSSLHGQLGYSTLEFPLYRPRNNFDFIVPDELAECVEWLNAPPKSVEDAEAVKKALRRKTFSFSTKTIERHDFDLDRRVL